MRESRKWKQSVARKLNGMTPLQQDAFFRKLREEYAVQRAAWEREHTLAAN